MQTRFTLRCNQNGEKCSFISLLAAYPFNNDKFLIKILSSFVKVILYIYITTVVCQGAWLPWKPCSWYMTHTKLFELNQSATKCRCFVWKIIMGELILMNLCRSALGVQFFETQCRKRVRLRVIAMISTWPKVHVMACIVTFRLMTRELKVAQNSHFMKLFLVAQITGTAIYTSQGQSSWSQHVELK